MTAEELRQLPDDGRLHELVEGVLIAMPRPSLRHGRLALKLGRLMEDAAGQDGIVAVEAGFLLRRSPDTVRGPDVAFVAASRLGGDQDDGFFLGAPDIAVEILSPSNSPAEIEQKVQEYLAAGARLVWVFDPKMRVVSIRRADGSAQALHTDDVLSGEDVLPNFSVSLRGFFSLV